MMEPGNPAAAEMECGRQVLNSDSYSVSVNPSYSCDPQVRSEGISFVVRGLGLGILSVKLK